MGDRENFNQQLEQAIAGLRSERPDAETTRNAGERVWQHLARQNQNGAEPQIDASWGCEEVRKSLDQYRAGTLPAARSLLIRDHLLECPHCRTSGRLAWNHELARPRPQHFKWLAAVAAVIVVAAVTYMIQSRLAVPAGSRATVESVDGALYVVNRAGEMPLSPGRQIGEGERVRTAAGSRAMLRLVDGSLVEVNEHAEFSVSMRRRDTTIHLDGGDIIVQAAHRNSGRLYVAGQDCLVAVTGTVFSVNSGIKGSRVSVIQGEVHVTEAGTTRVLHPGDQLSTGAGVAAVPIQREIAWSRNADRHLALLAELAHLQNKIEEKVQLPGLRYESRLLPLLPASTVVYAGIPNYGDAILQAGQLFQQELQESDVLREWWQQMQARRNGPPLEDVLQKLHDLGLYLGNEIVFSVGISGQRGTPLLIAQVQKPGLKEFIEQLSNRSNGRSTSDLRVLEPSDLETAGSAIPTHGPLVLIRPDFVVVGFDLAALRDFNAQINHGGGGFASTPLAQELQKAYQGGVGLLFAADLQSIAGEVRHGEVKHPLAFRQSGFSDVKYLIAERKDVAGQTMNRAKLAFNGQRRGIASWLAAPASIGGLDYISSGAGAVGALVMKGGGAEFDDLTAMIGAADSNFAAELASAESATGVNFKNDLAQTLGGNVVVALDGPILPVPSWKLVVEVYDPSRLQHTIEQLTAFAGAKAGQERAVHVEQRTVDGLTYYTLQFTDRSRVTELHYTFDDGYWILGPSQAIVMNAVEIHRKGNSLAKAPGFRALLPTDQFANVSALLYQNLAPVLAPIAGQLTPQQLQPLQALSAEAKPSLVCAYGEEDAIRVASNSRLFGLDLNTLALSTLLKLAHPPQGTR
jgi:FecR protein/Putative zinc-finger